MRQPRRDDLNDPIAVIDIGSNSARLTIYQKQSTGQLRVIGNARQPLRLVREVDRGRQLSVEAISVTLRTLADFRSMIRAYNAGHIVAVATAAIRDANNGKELIERARVELGLQIDVIDSHKEAYYGCVGGIRGLPVQDGIAFDLGGGSVQIVEFQNRRPGADCSLPLGSLRLSAAFLRHDPPAKREVRALSNYVERTLKDACPRRLSSGGVVVGVGGTIRNLAKIDARLHSYPIARVHGYLLSRERLGEIVELLCRKRMRSAGRIAGLSGDREDSIVGGAIAIQALVDAFGAHEIVVSGQGVREGLVHSVANEGLPSPQKVRDAALISLAGRFDTWNPDWAERRRVFASKLMDSLAPRAHPDIKMALEQAAFLLDIGRSVDFFDRFKHAATIVLDTELDGLSHRNILLLSMIIANAPHEDAGRPGNASVLKNSDRREIKRAAMLLKIADDMLQHWPKGLPAVFECRVGRKEIQVVGEGFEGWIPRGIGSRFERLFDRRLVVRSGAVRAAIVEGNGQ
jgi:exopolyphosphatase/guanosine-5'-triphosphate,3'-diphosphate pyrophosphatase